MAGWGGVGWERPVVCVTVFLTVMLALGLQLPCFYISALSLRPTTVYVSVLIAQNPLGLGASSRNGRQESRVCSGLVGGHGQTL